MSSKFRELETIPTKTGWFVNRFKRVSQVFHSWGDRTLNELQKQSTIFNFELDRGRLSLTLESIDNGFRVSGTRFYNESGSISYWQLDIGEETEALYVQSNNYKGGRGLKSPTYVLKSGQSSPQIPHRGRVFFDLLDDSVRLISEGMLVE